MEVSLIAAIFLLAVILMCHVGENFTERSFNSQIADLNALSKREANYHFKDSDFNRTDSKFDG